MQFVEKTALKTPTKKWKETETKPRITQELLADLVMYQCYAYYIFVSILCIIYKHQPGVYQQDIYLKPLSHCPKYMKFALAALHNLMYK